MKNMLMVAPFLIWMSPAMADCTAPADDVAMAVCLEVVWQEMTAEMDAALAAMRERAEDEGTLAQLTAEQAQWSAGMANICEAARGEVLDQATAPVMFYDCLQHQTWARAQALLAQLE